MKLESTINLVDDLPPRLSGFLDIMGLMTRSLSSSRFHCQCHVLESKAMDSEGSSSLE